MNCVSWLATKYKPTFMCLSVRQYQIIYFVIVRLEDIQDVVSNRIVRIDDWHTHHNAIFFLLFFKNSLPRWIIGQFTRFGKHIFIQSLFSTRTTFCLLEHQTMINYQVSMPASSSEHPIQNATTSKIHWLSIRHQHLNTWEKWTKLAECFYDKRNIETIISNFISDIRYRHRRIIVRLIYKPWIRNFKYGRCQLPDWWKAETSNILCNLVQ